MKALPVIQTKPEGIYCDNCHYQNTGIRRVLPDGDDRASVALAGDSPWTEEVATGRPFAGSSGKWLDSILSKRGMDRSSFLVLNAGTQCKPPFLGWNDAPEQHFDAEAALNRCRPYLDEIIISHPSLKAIVAMGNVALRRLTGFAEIETNHSYLFQTAYDIPCIPTFHPSSILQGNHNYTIAFVLAIAKAIEIANGSFQPTLIKVVEDPDPSFLHFPEGREISFPLMCDIETPKSLAGRNEEEAEDDPSYQIIRMGFSIASWQGVSFPFEGDYIRRAQSLIRRAKTLIFWNKNYDLPRLKANGFTISPDCTVVDAMWAWHWLYSDLPKSLAFAAPFFYNGPAWKHLASQRPSYYNGMDNAVQMGVYNGVKAQLIKDNRWERFWNHCIKVDPIYVSMGSAGVKVDKDARATFMAALEKEALAELVKVQELVPAKLVKVKESFKELKPPKISAKVTRRMIQSLIRIEKVEVPAFHKDGSPVLTEGGAQLTRPAWRRVMPFNPRSRPDLLDLMRELKVKVPKARGEDRESVEAKYLKRMVKYPIFRHCVNYSQRSKLISTYNWPLDGQDRAHTTYGYHPSTWRSSSRNVNLGNIPKRFELAKLFRRLLIAESGCKLIEIDRSAIEAVLVGYWAKSLAYINLAKAGVHSYLCSYVLGEPVPLDLPFKELKAALKVIKKRVAIEIYEGMKRVIHGSNYLLSAYGIHDEYEEYFPTLYSAEKAQDMYFNSPAGLEVRGYHKSTLEEVYAKKMIDNSFQYRHWFFGPLYKFNKREKRWVVDHEGDAKRAIAFRPQSDAAAIQREDLLALAKIDWLLPLLRLPTYDSIVIEAPNNLVDKSIEALYNQFKQPIKELGGLPGFDGTIGFEIKVGLSLGEMEEVVL
jgi:uracil-DNA glycosylase family 4